MFSLFKKQQETPAEYKRQAGEAFAGVREAAAQVSEHLGALADLFAAELQVYMKQQVRRMCYLAAACVLLAGAYLVACALLSVALHYWLGWLGALGTVLGVHVMGAVILVMAASRCRTQGIAPQTMNELKNDWQCLELMFKTKAKP